MGLDNPQDVDIQEGGQPLPPPPPLPQPLPQHALPQLPPQPEAAYWGFHQRLSMLRDAARQQAARATTLTNIAAALTSGISALNIIVSMISVPAMLVGSMQSTSTAQGTTSMSGGDQGLIVLMAVTIGLTWLLSVAVLVYGISVLVRASQLYARSYHDASQLFNTTNLALVFVHEDFWKQLQDQIAASSWIKLVGRSAYHTLEEHLDWCACHFPSLHKVAESRGEPSIWQLRLEEGVYKNRKWFMQDTWVYWACGCLLLVAMRIGLIISLMYTLQGGRYIKSRGVLVALCDFMLQPGAMDGAPSQPPPVYDAPNNY